MSAIQHCSAQHLKHPACTELDANQSCINPTFGVAMHMQPGAQKVTDAHSSRQAALKNLALNRHRQVPPHTVQHHMLPVAWALTGACQRDTCTRPDSETALLLSGCCRAAARQPKASMQMHLNLPSDKCCQPTHQHDSPWRNHPRHPATWPSLRLPCKRCITGKVIGHEYKTRELHTYICHQTSTITQQGILLQTSRTAQWRNATLLKSA